MPTTALVQAHSLAAPRRRARHRMGRPTPRGELRCRKTTRAPTPRGSGARPRRLRRFDRTLESGCTRPRVRAKKKPPHVRRSISFAFHYGPQGRLRSDAVARIHRGKMAGGFAALRRRIPSYLFFKYDSALHATLVKSHFARKLFSARFHKVFPPARRYTPRRDKRHDRRESEPLHRLRL